LCPLGDQKVTMTLPGGRTIRQARLLRAGRPLPVRQRGTMIEFTVPRLVDYEVVALEV
jgi:hypothetical protein